ncbi:MAG: cyclase family protein [Flavobacteriales bacterium]
MIATIEHSKGNFKVDFSRPLDISVPVSADGPQAWYVNKPVIAPVINRYFTGSVRLGGAVNFNNVSFNPHGHGTHTETVGHIARESFPISIAMKKYLHHAMLISVTPHIVTQDAGYIQKGDAIVTQQQLMAAIGDNRPEALVIRTLPNSKDKPTKNYSNTNFCYIEAQALDLLSIFDVQHLLVDLPSVDREMDGGLLKAHHAFWQYPHETRAHCTITEFIYVADEIADGEYLLELQVASFENDAAPSRPVLYQIF